MAAIATAGCSRGLGITQIVIGVLLAIFGIIAAAINPGYTYWATAGHTPIWGGILVLVTGIIGILYAKNTGNGCLKGWTIALNIILCIIMALDTIFYGIGGGMFVASSYISSWGTCYRYDYYTGRTRSYYCVKNVQCSACTGIGTIYLLCLLLCAVEWWISLFAAIYSCQCCGKSQNGTVVVAHQQTAGTVTVVNNGQPQMQQQGQMAYYPQQQQQQGYPPQQMMMVQPDGTQVPMMMQPQMMVQPDGTQVPMMMQHGGQPMVYAQQPQMQPMGAQNNMYAPESQGPPAYAEAVPTK